jgi:hypothetical protein
MRDELDKKLVETYPELYANRFGDMKETLMCWGFDCGDGWYQSLTLFPALLQCRTVTQKTV